MCKYVVLMILCCTYMIQLGICQLETECGIVAPEAETLVINGRVVKRAEFPWHVGLYDKSSKGIEQICGGTIVSSRLVVTAAHCVYRDGVGPYRASTFAVAAGKIYRDWSTSTDDEQFVQKIDVADINIPEQYKGAVNSYIADIAMLVLEKSFEFNSFVRPVCVRLDNEDNLNRQYGKVAGWGLTEEGGNASSILQTVRLPFVSFEDCYNNSPEGFRPLINHDKICAGYTNGTALCKGDSGGGLVFSRRNGTQELYYLYGIVSTSPRNEAMTSCSAYAYTAFTDFTKYHKWFLDIWLIQISKGDVCSTPNGPGVCKPVSECPLARADLRKGVRPQICGFVEKTPLVCCESTKRDSIHEDCDPIPAEASKVSRTGKKAHDKCIDYLQYVYPCENITYWEACTGTADQNLCARTKIGRNYKCQHRLSRLLFPSRTVGGIEAEKNEFPHMAALGIGPDPERVLFGCSGAVVSENFVLTLGSCTFSRDLGNVNFILVGTVDISYPINPKHLYSVSQIIRHPEFRWPNEYNDIALLRTATAIILDNSVYPACLHVGNVIDDSVMTVARWGPLGHQGNSIGILKKVDLQKFTTEECSKSIKPNENLKNGYDPETQLCAGDHKESNDTCKSNSGGPLHIYNEDVNCMYTVVGITSYGWGCSNIAKPAIYTRVSHYIPWIESIVWP